MYTDAVTDGYSTGSGEQNPRGGQLSYADRSESCVHYHSEKIPGALEGEEPVPRILIAGTGSGAGKTSITCGILNSLIRRGHSAAAFKCGPDYIDTMFHSRVLGVSTGNLDSFFTDRDKLLHLIWKNGKEKEISIVEGVMGYYDGIGFTDQGSSRDIAQLTDTPVVLLVNCGGMGCSVLAVLKGFLEFRQPSMIRGVIFNRMPESLYPEAKRVAEEMGICVFGYVPRQKQELLFQSRHLGLVTAREIDNFKEIVDRFSDQLERTIDLDGLMTLAKSAPPIVRKAVSGEHMAEPVRIAVAKDEAFCFLYRDNLDYLQEHGCEIVYFSPLKDSGPGEDIDGLILSGGYPELYAEKLAHNEAMRRQIRRKIENGLPCIAECGGFLYLHEELEGEDGTYHSMAGVLKGRCYKTEHLQRFGYLELKPEADCLLGETGDTIKAHSFHYWDSEHKGSAFLAVKPGSRRQWQEGISSDTLYAGFPHLYFFGNEKAADRFIAKAGEYHRERAQRHGEQKEHAVEAEEQKTCGWERRIGMENIPEFTREQYTAYLAGQMPCGIDEAAAGRAADRWDSIAKPLKGLGRLEELVIQIAGITGDENVRIGKRAVIVMCADNGIVEEGVTQTDSEVTAVVSLNIAKGTASINRMSDRAGIDVIPVDIGIARGITHPNLRAMKVADGTRNFLKGPAMSEEEVCRAVDTGIRLVRECREQGYELLATGEMGIGNTTTSSALIAAYLGLSAKDTVGRGAGLDDEGLARKRGVIARALETYPVERMSPLEILQTLGGLDLAGMAGIFIGGAVYRIPVIVDGLISAAAALAAVRICPQVRPFLLASHLSREPAAEPVMRELGLSPVIDGHLALGEGTGAVLLVPMLDMALEVYRENDSFSEIGIEAYQEYEDSGENGNENTKVNIDISKKECIGDIR